jgi:hypothetical protein
VAACSVTLNFCLRIPNGDADAKGHRDSRSVQGRSIGDGARGKLLVVVLPRARLPDVVHIRVHTGAPAAAMLPGRVVRSQGYTALGGFSR